MLGRGRRHSEAELGEDFLVRLGGMNGEELETLAKHCHEQAWIWEQVAETGEHSIEYMQRLMNIVEYQKGRARVFMEWAAAEEHEFGKWVEKEGVRNG